MKEEQYWLVILKAEDLFSSQGAKEIAKIIALTPTQKEPEFSALMDGMLDGLGFTKRDSSTAFSYDIGRLAINKIGRDNLPTLPKWDGKDLKLWIASRSKDL